MRKIIIVSLMLFCAVALADEPLLAPSKLEVYSNNKNYIFVSDPTAWVTSVYEVSKRGHRKIMWMMYGWFRDAYLSDDGEHLVVGDDGLGLIPTDYSKNVPMAYFFEKGRLVRFIKLKDIIRDFGKLEHTASHYHWGGCTGINPKGQFIISTVEKRRLIYDVKTGELVKVETE
jgi:hypothetical protein